jgi:4-diphosphocytidyl-2C-methyl-D-erythritol kinase
LINDFEQTVFPNYPALATIKEQLYDAGAIYASMTGTGSTVYGIFKTSGAEVNSPLFKVTNKLNNDFFLISINGTTVTYSVLFLVQQQQ